MKTKIVITALVAVIMLSIAVAPAFAKRNLISITVKDSTTKQPLANVLITITLYEGSTIRNVLSDITNGRGQVSFNIGNSFYTYTSLDLTATNGIFTSDYGSYNLGKSQSANIKLSFPILP